MSDGSLGTLRILTPKIHHFAMLSEEVLPKPELGSLGARYIGPPRTWSAVSFPSHVLAETLERRESGLPDVEEYFT